MDIRVDTSFSDPDGKVKCIITISNRDASINIKREEIYESMEVAQELAIFVAIQKNIRKRENVNAYLLERNFPECPDTYVEPILEENNT